MGRFRATTNLPKRRDQRRCLPRVSNSSKILCLVQLIQEYNQQRRLQNINHRAIRATSVLISSIRSICFSIFRCSSSIPARKSSLPSIRACSVTSRAARVVENVAVSFSRNSRSCLTSSASATLISIGTVFDVMACVSPRVNHINSPIGSRGIANPRVFNLTTPRLRSHLLLYSENPLPQGV